MVCSKRGKDHTNAHPTHYKRNRGRLLACSTVQAARRRGTYAVPTSCNHKKWKGPRPSSCLFIQVLFVGCRTFDRCFVWANRKTECIHIHVFCLLLCVVASQWSSLEFHSHLTTPKFSRVLSFSCFNSLLSQKKSFQLIHSSIYRKMNAVDEHGTVLSYHPPHPLLLARRDHYHFSKWTFVLWLYIAMCGTEFHGMKVNSSSSDCL